jgi:uncharacterized membrane protein YfcA
MPELLPNLWWGLALLGVVAGVVSGALGVGSGALLVPALILVFHFPQKSAQGTCLAVMVPVVLMGAVRYKLNPEVDIPALPVALVALGGVVGAVVGSELAARLPAQALRKAFAIFLVVVAAKMLLARSAPRAATPGTDGPAATASAAPAKGDSIRGTTK